MSVDITVPPGRARMWLPEQRGPRPGGVTGGRGAPSTRSAMPHDPWPPNGELTGLGRGAGDAVESGVWGPPAALGQGTLSTQGRPRAGRRAGCHQTTFRTGQRRAGPGGEGVELQEMALSRPGGAQGRCSPGPTPPGPCWPGVTVKQAQLPRWGVRVCVHVCKCVWCMYMCV